MEDSGIGIEEERKILGREKVEEETEKSRGRTERRGDRKGGARGENKH